MKQAIHCKKCGKLIKKEGKGLCRCCYIKEWKKINYTSKKPEGYKEYKEVLV